MSHPEIHVLDRGFVRLIDHMGTDLTVVNAARVSFGKRKEAFDEKDALLVQYLAEHEHTAPFRHAYLTFHVKAPIFVFRQWMKHRIACLTADTEITFLDSTGKATPRLRKTLGELWEQWSKGQGNGTAPDSERVARVRSMVAEGVSDREIARITEVDRTTVRRIREGRFSHMRSAHSRIRKMNLRVLNERENSFEVGHVADIVERGVQPVYRLTLANGKTLTLTTNHRVLTSEGWQRFGEAVGLRHPEGAAPEMTRPCSLMVNGEEAYRSGEWLQAQRDLGRSLGEMAALAGCSPHTIRKWLRVHHLQFRPDETRFMQGDRPWNMGRTYKNGPMNLTDAQRRRMRERRSGDASNWWRGGLSSERQKIGAWTARQAEVLHERNGYHCQACGVGSTTLHAHHILPVWLDPSRAMDVTNLASICGTCHRAIHRSREAELAFARTLVGALPSELEQRPRRTGEHRLLAHPVAIVTVEFIGLRPTYDLCLQGPWHNFLANGIVVHNSDFNEISGRYVEFPQDEFHVPAAFRLQALVNKQGSEGALDQGGQEAAHGAYLEACHQSVAQYKRMIALGVCREQARCVLPLALFSEVYWTASLQAVAHFLHLRLDSHAQWEIRQYAQAVRDLTEPLFPESLGALMA
jgi:thymidylate synthase (FAD)